MEIVTLDLKRTFDAHAEEQEGGGHEWCYLCQERNALTRARDTILAFLTNGRSDDADLTLCD